MSKVVPVSKTAIIGCVHVPFEDPKTLEATLDFLKYWKPEEVILNGDIYDLYALSSHKKDAKQSLDFQVEVDAAREFNRKLRSAVGKDCSILFNQGNHEARWEAYHAKYSPETQYLDDNKFESWFRLAETNIRYNRGVGGSYANTYVGAVCVGHFPILRADSGASAKAIVLKRFESVVTHHSHRMGTYVKTTPSGRFIGQEGGCLCTLTPDWTEAPDWEQGFVILQTLKGKDRFWLDAIRVVNGAILFNGRLF
jgi:hypothetical protein